MPYACGPTAATLAAATLGSSRAKASTTASPNTTTTKRNAVELGDLERRLEFIERQT
jgi:hypothetical protein